MPRNTITIRRAEAIVAEERSWQCRSCPNQLMEHEKGPDCDRCKEHWLDVANGAFDDWFEDWFEPKKPIVAQQEGAKE